jgi:hypothetical protein
MDPDSILSWSRAIERLLITATAGASIWMVVLGGSGPVFGGQRQLGAAAAHVKIGVTPAV